MVYFWNRSLRVAMKEVNDVEGDSERERKRVPGLFEIRNQAPLPINRLGIYNRGSRRIDFFSASVPEMKTHFEMIEATWDAMLQKKDCNAPRDNAFKHP